MKKIIYIALSVFLSQLLWCDDFFLKNNTDHLVVVIMIKDEATVIRKTLEPFILGGIKQFLVYDTGPSTDGTQGIVRAYFEENNITNYQLIEEPFIDFSASRNKALRLAEQYFPYATFMLMLDAEWYMTNVEQLIQYTKNIIHEQIDLYALLIINARSSVHFYTPRLIRMHKEISFYGKVHEIPYSKTYAMLPEDFFFTYAPEIIGLEKSLNRWKRDLEILKKEHELDPTNERVLFYLAQTYEGLSMREEAYAHYYKRTVLNIYGEDLFMTWYCLARVADDLYRQTKDHDWLSRAISGYFCAWNVRTSRIEPIVKLADLFLLEKQFHAAYVILKQIMETPYPLGDQLFIEKLAYDYTRYDLLGISAWYVGDYHLGKKSVLKALLYNKEMSHLHRNLALYVLKTEVA